MSYEPTDDSSDLVRRMCIAGITQDQIARVIGMGCTKQFRRLYRNELDLAIAEALAAAQDRP